MKLNLLVLLQDLDGNSIKENGIDLTLNKIIASRLVENPTGIDSIKAFDWAQTLYKEGEIEVDHSDLVKIKTFIEAAPLAVLVKAPCLKAIHALELAELK
jgi:hypothetical protein